MEMRETCDRALAAIAAAGADTGEMAHPPTFAKLADAHNVVMSYETARQRADVFAAGVPAISQQFHDLIETGQRVGEAEYHQALSIRDRANSFLDQLFRDTDVLLVPSAPGAAPKGLGATGNPLFSRMWNLLQVPSMAIPFATDQNGLPLGIQLIAPRGHDARLIGITRWVHEVFAQHRS